MFKTRVKVISNNYFFSNNPTFWPKSTFSTMNHQPPSTMSSNKKFTVYTGTRFSPTKKDPPASSSSSDEEEYTFLTPKQREDGSYYLPDTKDGVPSSIPPTPEKSVAGEPPQSHSQQTGTASSSSSSSLGVTNTGVTWESTFKETTDRHNKIHATFQKEGTFDRRLFHGLHESKVRRKVPDLKLSDFSVATMLQLGSIRQSDDEWDTYPDDWNGTAPDFDFLLDVATGQVDQPKYHECVAFVSRIPMPLPLAQCRTRRPSLTLLCCDLCQHPP